MPLTGAIIVPHPPVIVPAVGRGREREVQSTVDAYRAAARQAAAWGPGVLIVTSPHCVMYADYFHILPRQGRVRRSVRLRRSPDRARDTVR